MKKTSTILILLLGIFLFSSCSNEVAESTIYKVNEPIFMPYELFRQSVRIKQEHQAIEKQGNIAFFGEFMYISEPEKGIHILDNRNPKNPVGVGFIEILGNNDLIIKDNLLYADSYVDLVWFDISDPSHPVLNGRKNDVFPTALPAADNGYPCDYEKSMDKTNGVVVGWKSVERTDSYNRSFYYYHENLLGGGMQINDEMYSSNSEYNKSGVSRFGSMSRFAIYQNFLYTVLDNQLGIFDIKSATPEKMGDNIFIGNNIETIFSYKNYLYIGTPAGLMIYSIANPVKAEHLVTIKDILGCNPVAVENDKAYITTHPNNFSGEKVNQLIVYDISDPKTPKELISYDMTKPKGLAIDNGTLFVCDDGLKVFNAANPLTIMAPENLYFHKQEIEGYNLLVYNKLLIVFADDGIYQYDFTDVRDIKPLSYIKVKN